VKKVANTGNYINSYWNVIRYQNYSRIKLPDPVPLEKPND
jgi:hypothetical protein